MNEAIQPHELLNQIKLPEQDIELLTFCLSNKSAKVKAWVGELKLTQIQKSSIELYQALPQVLRLKCTARTRFDILEALRPAVHHCTAGLTKEFLNQPLMLPEHAQKTAIIAQALQKQMLDGYSLCLREWIAKGKVKTNVKEKFSYAIHRALTGISLLCLRSYQLYTPIPPGVWLRAHVLYLTAKATNALDTRITDNLLNSSYSQVATAYKRILAMACSRLNQVTPQEAGLVHKSLEQWAQHVQLEALTGRQIGNAHIVDLTLDKSPSTRKAMLDEVNGNMLRIDLESLCKQLQQFQSQQDKEIALNQTSTINVEDEISTNLLRHLQNSWNQLTARRSDRQSTEISAQVSFGLIQCHQQLCGNVDFSTFVGDKKSGSNRFGFEALKNSLLNSMQDPAANDDNPVCQAIVRNEGDNGLCLSISDAKKNKAEAGELIAIRENGRRHWKLGIVRWLRKQKDHTLIGVKLLSTQPQPYGIAMFYDVGGYTEYMRAFFLPDVNGKKDQASIVTSTVPFREKAKVRMKQDDMVLKGILGNSLVSTSKVAQFELDPSKLEEVAPSF